MNAALKFLMMLTFLFASHQARASGPTTFVYEGRLFDTSGAPSTATVSFLVRIYNPAGTCLLREEQTSPIALAGSDGQFSITIGANSPTANDPSLSTATVFANHLPITGASSCSYVPVSGDSRKIRILIHDGSTYTAMNPDLTIGTAPYAMQADSLQGLGPNQFLKTNTGAGLAVTQTNIEAIFSSTANVSALSNLIAGTSAQYAKSSTNGTLIQPRATDPGSPVAGQMWFDSSLNQMRFYDGTSVQSVGAGGGGVASVGATAPLTNTGTVASPVLSIAAASGSVNGYLTSTDWNMFNAKLGPALPNGSLFVGNGANQAAAAAPAGDVSMSNTGAFSVLRIRGVNVGSTAPSVAQVLRYNGSSWDPSTLTVSDVGTLSTQLANKLDAASMPANCGASQTLTFSSPTGTWQCSTIAFPAGVVMNGGNGLAAPMTIGTNDSQSLSLRTAGINRVTIDNGGNVGVGTTTPAFPLQVVNPGHTKAMLNSEHGSDARAELHLTGNSASTHAGYAISYGATTNDFRISRTANGMASFDSLVTIAPGLLRLTATDGTSSEAKIQLERFNNSVAIPSGGFLGRMIFNGYNGSTYSVRAAEISAVSSEQFSPSGSGSHLLFWTTPTGNTTPVERLRIDTNGQVGIGTTTPRASLDVTGAIVSANTSASTGPTFDFASGNTQFTNSNCGNFDLHNLKSGGEYRFIVKGASSTTCTFTAYSGVGTGSLVVHLPVGHTATTASKHTLYTFVVAGADVYVNWSPGL